MNAKKLKERHDENARLLYEYIKKNAGCHPKQVTADLGWTLSKLNIVYKQNKSLYGNGFFCKDSITDTMANVITLGAKIENQSTQTRVALYE